MLSRSSNPLLLVLFSVQLWRVVEVQESDDADDDEEECDGVGPRTEF